MKRISLALLSACALSAPCALTPCAFAQSEMAADPVAMAPKSAATVDALMWRFQPPVGSRWQMRTFTRSKMVQNIPAIEKESAQKMELNIIQHLTADYDVLSRDQFGASTIRITYRSMKTDGSSKINGKVVPAPKMNTSSINGAHFTIKQAPDGRVWGVTGMKTFMRRLLQASGVTDPVALAQSLKMSESMMSEKSLKSISMMAGKLPAYPIRVGESWTYSTELPAGFPLQLKIAGKRTLKSLTPEIAMIAEEADFNGGKMDMKVPMPPGAPQIGKIAIDLSEMRGAITGFTKLERESGVPLETIIHQTIGGAFKVTQFDKAGKVKMSARVPQNTQISTRVVLEPR